jgi:hypothetical protein
MVLSKEINFIWEMKVVRLSVRREGISQKKKKKEKTFCFDKITRVLIS